MFEAIAVSDHDTERRKLFYEVLTELNYRVTTLPSRKELMELLTRERPQCVILAVDQSDRSVADVLRPLRELDKTLKIVVLAPPELASPPEPVLANDPRVSILSEGLNRLSLIRSILTFFKTRYVEQAIEKAASLEGVILNIEDDPRVAQLLKAYLERRGYHVTNVANGEAAVLRMQVDRPKVVILDILLPGMDGLLTLRRLKGIDPSVPIIVSSGLEDTDLMQEAKAAGAAAYLVKPFDLAKLETVILTAALQKAAR
ncbi:MAG: response regulator [Candidatus Omnitrophica bacterium]|nr:response regulator [Candidatus Omnitrophota bacterium]MBI3020846.1 response regulator [Candidatus Omnitrophota bacterium]MBI3083767.1 response regulator [Candidatus Omnitrophota bacterium]